MIGLEMHVNGKKVCTAGTDGGHLQAMLMMFWGQLGEEMVPFANLRRRQATTTIVGTHCGKTVCWPKADLGIGDEVTFKVVETDNVDPGFPKNQQPVWEPTGWEPQP